MRRAASTAVMSREPARQQGISTSQSKRACKNLDAFGPCKVSLCKVSLCTLYIYIYIVYICNHDYVIYTHV